MTPAMLVLFQVRFILELKPLLPPLRTVILNTTIYLCVVILVFTLYDTHLCFIIQSMLPGQRLSACTCPGESHPGPKRQDGSYVGRSAPEIDLFEALVAGKRGQVSQSAQWAPFNVSLFPRKSLLRTVKS
jgi:beta-glucan synthesis-associated protein SKN1